MCCKNKYVSEGMNKSPARGKGQRAFCATPPAQITERSSSDPDIVLQSLWSNEKIFRDFSDREDLVY